MRAARTGFVFAAISTVTLALAFPADAALGKARDGVVSFSAKGPMGLKIEGKTSEIAVREQDGKVHFVVSLANLDTGMALRNKHMRDKYLEVAKYPNAELVIERSALQVPADGNDSGGTVQGTMSIHGKTQPVIVTYKAHRTGSTYHVEGGVPLNINKFGIDVPSYAGVTVKPDVDVVVRVNIDD